MKVAAGSISDSPLSAKLFDPVRISADLMTKHNLHMIPVVGDDLRVVGIVGVSDVLDLISPGEEKEGILIEVSGLTPDDDDLYDITYFMASKFSAKFAKLSGHNNGNSHDANHALVIPDYGYHVQVVLCHQIGRYPHRIKQFRRQGRIAD